MNIKKYFDLVHMIREFNRCEKSISMITTTTTTSTENLKSGNVKTKLRKQISIVFKLHDKRTYKLAHSIVLFKLTYKFW